MHIHILGICGTFMAGIAELAAALGHRVSGSDTGVYPPMSTFLSERGIAVHEGYDKRQLTPSPDLVLIGNALSRGNEAVEHTLNEHLPYMSGAQWLAESVLYGRHVVAVAGTHGKTTTTSLLTWILQQCGFEPGYLIGGIAHNFATPASLGADRYFVIEADEYDTAFFDKRSKFVHYRPDTLIINNLEYDHADIFPDLDAIKRQFHHLVRTVPANGTLIVQSDDDAIQDVLAQGCWSETVSFGINPSADWQILKPHAGDAQEYHVARGGSEKIEVNSPLIGHHNALNATAALSAAVALGASVTDAVAAIESFGGVKRRLEVIGRINDVTVYDDFAHHPTAIQATLTALRAAAPSSRIICVLEPRSNTMRLGVHAPAVARALDEADVCYLYADSALAWDLDALAHDSTTTLKVCATVEDIVAAVSHTARAGDHIVIMSNGGFANIHTRLLSALG